MTNSKRALESVNVLTGYTVVAAGKACLVHDDIYECLKALREHTKAELYRNEDHELLAFTSGTGPGRGGREIE
jgi:hypothetical protein